MKKIIFFLLLSLSGLNILNAQLTIYSEDFGGIGNTTLPSSWTSATGDWIIDPNDLNGGGVPVCGLPLSSGNSVLAGSDNGGNENAVSAPFSTVGKTNIIVNYNAYRSTGAPNVVLEVSSDNVTYIPIPGWSDVVADDAWHPVNQFTLPVSMENQATVYLRWSYTATGNGFFFAYDDIIVKATATPIFYWNGTGALNLLSSWGDNTNGTGTQPTSFTLNNQVFFLVNASAAILVAPWTIGGTGTVLHVGSLTGTTSINFTIPASNALTLSGAGKITVNNQATLTLQNTSFPTFSQVNLITGSTVDYAQASTVSLWAGAHHNLIVSNAQKNQLGNLTVNGLLNLNGANLNMSNSSLNSLTLNGTVSGSGQILTGNSRIVVGGTGVLGTLTFGVGATSRTINQLTYNRASGGVLTLGSNLTVSSSANLTNGLLDLNGNRLTLNGNITFPGSVANGSLKGSTSSSLTIGGTGSITNSLLLDQTSASTRAISEIILNRSSANLTFGNAIDAWGSITPTVGTINTGGVLTLKADASNKGRIGQIGASGTLSGNVTVEVFKPAGATGWINLCSGGVNGNNMNSWNSSFAITCSVCPDGWDVGGTNFTSIYEYDETTASGNSADPLHYIELGVAPASKPIDSKTGYWVYLGNGFPNTTAITIPLTGGVNTKNSSGNINLTLTGGAGAENGWNLVANPFPSPIVANQITGSNFNTSNMIAYDPDTDSNVPFSGSAVIPTGQAFMVQATAGGANLTPAESWKSTVADNNSILRTSSASNFYFDDFLINVTSNIVPTNFFTQAYFTFGNGNTSGYETSDCPSMPGQLATTPRFYSKFNGMDLLRNALPSLTGTVSIPLLMRTGYAGAYTFNPINLSKLPAGACVTLVDLVNNISHNLRTGAYTSNILANATTPQFELRIVVNNASSTSSFLHPTCTKLANASITAEGSGTGPFNYIWKDVNSNIIQTNNNISGPNTLNNIYAGVYIVDITKNNTCQNARATFTLNSTTPLPVANFTANNTTVIAGNNVPVSFSNLSTNATGYEWNFNDGSNTVNTANASHVFTDEGNYSVVLKANNGTCLDTSIYTTDIYVQASPVGIKDKVESNNNYFISKDQDGMFVKFNYSSYSEVMFEVTNILGQTLIPSQILNVSESKHYFNVPENEKLIFVTITENGVRKTSKVIAK